MDLLAAYMSKVERQTYESRARLDSGVRRRSYSQNCEITPHHFSMVMHYQQLLSRYNDADQGGRLRRLPGHDLDQAVHPVDIGHGEQMLNKVEIAKKTL